MTSASDEKDSMMRQDAIAQALRKGAEDARDDALYGGLRRCAVLTDRAREYALQVGSIPPAPSTLRARFGRLPLAVVRRMLFWYTPQIGAAFQCIIRAVEEQSTAARNHARLLDRVLDELAAAQSELAQLRIEVNALRLAADRTCGSQS